MVAVDVLLGRRGDAPRPDVVLCIVDASNLQRNLYLVSQVLELGLPTVVALNMIDVARAARRDDRRRRGCRERLGIPVIEVQANRRRGVARAEGGTGRCANAQPTGRAKVRFPSRFNRKWKTCADG